MLIQDKQIKIFLEELIIRGIKNIVISPGSRSTALVNNILVNKEFFDVTMILDERSAGYFALGISKKTNSPTVLICTSGTATLNYSPAVAEAFYSKIPLLIITADRPMHFRNTGANQTLNQNNLYQNNIKWFYDIPVNADNRIFSNIAHKALSNSDNYPKGPVQINWQFTEPFTDGNIEKIQLEKKVTIEKNEYITDSEENFNNFLEITNNKNGILLVGQHFENKNNLLKLANLLNWPIVADPLSNLREKKDYKENIIIDAGDILFRSSLKNIIPDIVLHIGSLPVSKFISSKLERANKHIFLENSNRIAEGFNKIDLHLKTSSEVLVRYLEKNKDKILSVNNKWKYLMRDYNVFIRKKTEGLINNYEELNYKKSIIDNLPKDSNYIVGNSLPIRHLDIILNKNIECNFIGNRGLSGIDGNISIASGYSKFSRSNTYLDIGDLAFFHDIGSLINAVKHSKNLTIVVNNNNGGQIFNLLPQKTDLKDIYKEWFITPHNDLSIRKLSESFGCNYENIDNKLELEKLIKNFTNKNINIIELNINSNYDNYNDEINSIVNCLENNYD